MVTIFYHKKWSLYLVLKFQSIITFQLCIKSDMYFLIFVFSFTSLLSVLSHFSWYTANGIGQNWMKFQKSSAWGYLGLHRSRKKPRFMSAKELYPYLQGTATPMWTATGWWTFLHNEEFLANQGLILVHYGFLIIQVSVPQPPLGRYEWPP